jgi:hypothetical protein
MISNKTIFVVVADIAKAILIASIEGMTSFANSLIDQLFPVHNKR